MSLQSEPLEKVVHVHPTPTETNGDIDVIAPQSDADGTGGDDVRTGVPKGRGRGRLLALVALVAVVALVVWLAWPSSSKPIVPAHAVISPTNAHAVTTVGGQELLALLHKAVTPPPTTWPTRWSVTPAQSVAR